MNMFDWEAFAVTSSFYVYWVVTVPLTIATIGGWAWWWSIEKKRFLQDVQQAETNAQPGGKGKGFGRGGVGDGSKLA